MSKRFSGVRVGGLLSLILGVILIIGALGASGSGTVGAIDPSQTTTAPDPCVTDVPGVVIPCQTDTTTAAASTTDAGTTAASTTAASTTAASTTAASTTAAPPAPVSVSVSATSSTSSPVQSSASVEASSAGGSAGVDADSSSAAGNGLASTGPKTDVGASIYFGIALVLLGLVLLASGIRPRRAATHGQR